MRFLKLNSRRVIFGLVFGVFSVFSPVNAFADTEAFYFDDFTADYYLTSDEDGVSHLKVEETFTAVFPSYNQNKGFCRQIPYTNQNNLNVTLKDLNKNNITLTRNGSPEPIYSIDKTNQYFEVCTGDESYVHGRQVYKLVYSFERVVTDFTDYQELYWDTNGTGWFQKFNSLTARVHFDKEKYDGKNWCYVGKLKDSNQDRCTVSEIEDGLMFKTGALDRFENVTFDVQFKSDSFVVPPPEKNYTLVLIMLGVVAICGLCLISPIKRFRKTAEKRSFYKGYFIKPEYQPHKTYNVAEMAEIYIGDRKDSRVAVMLEMIVNRKIQLIKDEESKKEKWKIKVLDLNGVQRDGEDILKILKGGEPVKVGDVIDVKKNTPSEKLAKIGKDYDTSVINRLKEHGLAEKEYTQYLKKSGGIVSQFFGFLFAFWYVIPFAIIFFMEMVDSNSANALIGDVVGRDAFVPVTAGTVIVTIVTISMLRRSTTKYLARTTKGLETSRYMDGLKLYISMAEAERLKMLQSVEGADLTPAGIVHLYEKLLPYAAVLGLEKSWMKEMEEYYKIKDVEEPDWHANGLDSHRMYSVANLATRNAAYSASYSPSSFSSGGGGFSSGFSGGGGGGFSGGGGGGGGGHGR